ncbi:uncharacterized protein DS421_11g330070 [Arachis hypogaea]|nr:uncharacterized protein DS421_11g330070 [Arachis hypogaea]
MTTGSRNRSSGTCGRSRGWASTESPRAAQSSPSILATLSTPVMSQAVPSDQQFIMVPNQNWVPPSATPPADVAMTSTELAVGDTSNAPEQDAPPPLLVIRMKIWPDGMQLFAPNTNACTQQISELKFIWDAEHNLMIRKIYDHGTAKCFQQVTSDVGQGKDHLTSWIRPNIKRNLETHFRDNKGFRYHRLTNIANRASPKSSRYTGGSVTFMKMKTRLFKSLDHEVTLAETFKYTHTLKANKERFANDRSAAHYEEYQLRLQAVTQQSQLPSGAAEVGSETLVVDPNKIWCETAFEPHKNSRFELVSFFASGLRSSALVASAASFSATSPTDSQEVIDLRKEMEEYNQQMHAAGNSDIAGRALTAAPTPLPSQGDHDTNNDDKDYHNL